MTETPMEVDVQEVKRLLDQKAITLIDCREPEEWELAKIQGALLMPMSRWGELSSQLAELSGSSVVVHCHHGSRSLRVTRWMRENGFPEARNMTGGIHAWSLEIDPEVPQY